MRRRFAVNAARNKKEAMNENEIATLALDICFKIQGNTDQGCLKVFMKKYFVMSGRKQGYLLKDNKELH